MKIIDEKDDAAGNVDNMKENDGKTEKTASVSGGKSEASDPDGKTETPAAGGEIPETEKTDAKAVNAGADETTVSGGRDEEAIARGYEMYRKIQRRNRYPNWIDLLAIVGIFLVSSMLVQVAYFIAVPLVKQPLGGLVSFILYSLSLLLAIIFLIVFQRHRGLRKNFIRLNVGRMNLPLVLWGFLLVFIISVVLEPLLALFPEKYLDMLDRAIGTGGWAILSVVVIAPIMEEMFFRGLIAGPLKERNGAWSAILVSAIIFGVVHLIPQQVVYAFAIGIVLGYIYVRTESLAAVIVIHALNNGIAYLSAEITGNSNLTMRSLIGNDTFYYILYGGCLVIMVVAALGMARSLKRKSSQETEETENIFAAEMKNNEKSSGQVDTK